MRDYLVQRRRQLAALLGGLLLGTFVAPVAAQTYPSRPIRIVVPFAAGSTSDNLARTFAEVLRNGLNVTVTVENRPGASGVLGMDAVARSAPDGYTLMISSSATHSAGPWLLKQVPYHAVKDFAPVARLVTVPFVLAIPASRPEQTLRQFVDYAKANEGKLNYGYGTSTVQVAAAAFANVAGFKAEGIPYKGQSMAVNDVIAGHVDFMFGDNAVVMPQANAGKLRALAITSQQRSPQAPNVPTLAESGYQSFDIVAWVGLSAPAKTPRDIVQRIHAVIEESLARPEMQQKLLAQGLEPAPARLADFESFVAAQYDSWGRRVRDAGVKPE